MCFPSLFPFLVQNNQILISLLHNLSINDHHSNESGVLSFTGILADGVMASRIFAEALARMVHLGRVTIHPAEELTLDHSGGDSCTRVSMRRCPSARTIVDLDTNEGLAGCVGELVVVKDLDVFAGAIAAND